VTFYSSVLGIQMNFFDHEKLDAYQATIELVVLINEVVGNITKLARVSS
jgi:hypothetical protein